METAAHFRAAGSAQMSGPAWLPLDSEPAPSPGAGSLGWTHGPTHTHPGTHRGRRREGLLFLCVPGRSSPQAAEGQAARRRGLQGPMDCKILCERSCPCARPPAVVVKGAQSPREEVRIKRGPHKGPSLSAPGRPPRLGLGWHQDPLGVFAQPGQEKHPPASRGRKRLLWASQIWSRASSVELGFKKEGCWMGPPKAASFWMGN